MSPALASLFTWYSMRCGTLLVGSEQDSFVNDLRRLPRLVLAFLLAPLAWMRRRSRRLLNYGLLILACLILPPRCFAQDSRGGTQPALNAEEIMAAMMSRNEARAAALQGYTGHRFYHLNYRGFPSDKDAEMVVEVRYSAPSTKQFTVLSQNNSSFIINRILKRLLSSEEEAQSPENRQETALTPRNYLFELLGQEVTDQGRTYVLKVQPKVKNKFLYRGNIWVDADDFAIARIEAEPARNPSFWISSTHIQQKYAKFKSFWLPTLNESTSKIRLGGTATLLIDYRDYTLPDNPNAAPAPSRAEKPISSRDITCDRRQHLFEVSAIQPDDVRHARQCTNAGREASRGQSSLESQLHFSHSNFR